MEQAKQTRVSSAATGWSIRMLLSVRLVLAFLKEKLFAESAKGQRSMGEGYQVARLTIW
jgi:hypothetical protein